MCVNVAVSVTASSSAATATVTGCCVLQFPVVNVRLGGMNVTSVLPVRDSVTVTSPMGCEFSDT